MAKSFEVQIYNPVLNEGLYLSEDIYTIDTNELLHRKGELLTTSVLAELLAVGYESIYAMKAKKETTPFNWNIRTTFKE
jgi:hypothetical protein